MKFPIMQFPSLLLPHRPKYIPQHHILEHPQPRSPISVRDQVSHPYKTTHKIIVQYVLTFMFLNRQKVLDRMLAGIPCIHSQISELCHTLNGFVYFYVVILSCILFMKHENMKFRQVSLLATNKASVFFFIVCMLSPSKLTSASTRS
jgi:hypothetical protein